MDKSELDALKIEREPEPGRRRRWPWLVGLVAAVAAAAGVGSVEFLHAAPVTVETVTVTPKTNADPAGASGASVLNASGYVVAELSSTVSSQITGQITQVLATEGEHVKKGQVLARLDDRSQKASVASARSQLETDRAEVQRNEAQLHQDMTTLHRTRALAGKHMVSDAALDKAQSQVQIDKASLAAARARVQGDRDALESAKVQLENTVIRAPFAGVVTGKYAHPGEMISPAAVGGYTKTGICQLVDMSSLEIDVDVNETYIHRVHNGMRVKATLDAYPDWRIPAHVIGIVPTADRQKATVKVRIAFDKLDPRILPDMGVQVWFYKGKTGQRQASADSGTHPGRPAITVPQDAVHGSGHESYVYTVVDSHARRQPVTTGGTADDRVTVTGGLDAGDVVVTHADKPLKNGTAVRRKQAG